MAFESTGPWAGIKIWQAQGCKDIAYRDEYRALADTITVAGAHVRTFAHARREPTLLLVAQVVSVNKASERDCQKHDGHPDDRSHNRKKNSFSSTKTVKNTCCK
jgi:hypothetical protein